MWDNGASRFALGWIASRASCWLILYRKSRVNLIGPGEGGVPFANNSTRFTLLPGGPSERFEIRVAFHLRSAPVPL
jgi:hypothetical protein